MLQNFLSDYRNRKIADNVIYIFIGLAVLVNLSGLFDVLMGPDATLYASISKSMVLNHDYVNMYYGGQDWLDKPHLPFWIVAFSFKIFGIHTWSYKLPAVLFLLTGAYYTYLLAKDLYNKKVGLWAVLILLTAQHIILSNNDVKAEPYLTCFIIGSVYHFYKASLSKNIFQLIAGSLLTGLAIMTKGMFALIPIGSALIGDLIIKGKIKSLFQWRWALALILTAVLILPELYCLYKQFDLHPEKKIFGRTNVSGIRFFFWDSQFGRFFNTGPIKGKGNPLFYVHTLLWSFLPWSILLIAAITKFIRKNRRDPGNHEWYCVSASLMTFILFSASRFQLPHYLNIIFPFFSILVAQYLTNITSVGTIAFVQNIIGYLLLLFPVFLQFFYAPDNFAAAVFLPVWAFLFALFILMGNRANVISTIVYRSAFAVICLNIYLDLSFYPSLIHYQAGSTAALWINKNTNGLPAYTMQWSSPYAFYLNQRFSPTDSALRNVFSNDFILFLSNEQLNRLIRSGCRATVLKTMQDYPITRLNFTFLNKTTREKTLRKMDLVEIRR